MVFEKEQQIVAEIKQYITENLPLSKLSDEELQEKVEAITMEKLSGQYISIEQQVSIVEQVYSSIRGFGLLAFRSSARWPDPRAPVPHG